MANSSFNLSDLLAINTSAFNGFTFTKIADTNDPFSGGLFGSSINDEGRVAFGAVPDGGRFSIFTGSGGPVTFIAEESDSFDISSTPIINNQGTVVFRAQLLDEGIVTGEGIFTGSGGAITTIADTSGIFSDFPDFENPSINDEGMVAFSASLKSGLNGIFVGDNRTPANVTNTIAEGTGNPFIFLGDNPAINNEGFVAFQAFEPSESREGIFIGNNTTPPNTATTIVDSITIADQIGSPFNFFGRSNPINDEGTVAFLASVGFVDENFVEGIFTSSGGPITTIADTTGSFLRFDSSPAINNEGTVAFEALAVIGEQPFTRQVSGIFTGSDPVADKVIATGDSLLGSTVEDLFFADNKGLNNSGQIAFFATLEDGTSGLFRADPTINGTPNEDFLIGTPNNERINGFDGDDKLFGRSGNDTLDGGAGRDNLFGNDGYDSLLGSDGRDFLGGGRGDDLLDGGADNDLLFGGRGDDEFVLRKGDGLDTIFDYRDGRDSFLLADGLAFEDLTLTQGFGQTVISVSETSEELAALLGVDANDIGAEDFSTLV